MTTIFENATNAACPQRPTWQLTPVGYKWAEAVLLNYNKPHICGMKKRTEAAPKMRKIGEVIFSIIAHAAAIFRITPQPEAFQ